MRIQIMLPSGDSLSYPTHITWDVDAWTSESLDNKPFFAIDAAYNTYVADPIMGRVLIFDQTGNFLHAFGGFGNSDSEIGLVGGVSFDPQGKLWVVDANYNRLMRFPISQLPLNDQTQSEENLGN
jgi:DNA-binding beta-propeller fold protein YncE